MSDHYHYVGEIQGAADDRHSHPDLERDISGVESDVCNHRHYDLEREDESLRRELDGLRKQIRRLEDKAGEGPEL